MPAFGRLLGTVRDLGGRVLGEIEDVRGDLQDFLTKFEERKTGNRPGEE